LHYFEDTYPLMPHPVVREHPVSKRKVLFVNPQFTIKIKDMDETESLHLLQLLFDQAKVPEYQYRHHWEPGTLVIWDNRSVQHYAVHDYYPHRRLMERLTIKGTDRPHMAEAVADAASLKSRKKKFPDNPKVKHGGHAPKRLAQ
jgi:taurine dioxygenase